MIIIKIDVDQIGEIMVQPLLFPVAPPHDVVALFVRRGQRADGNGGVGGRDGFGLGEDPAAVVLDGVADGSILARVVDGVERQIPAARLVEHQAERLLRTLDIAVRQLFVEVVIDHRVGDLRPAVDQIPPDDAGAAPFAEPEALDKVFFRLGLGDLACEGEAFEAFKGL
mgnify:CR=1 FL=1